MEFKLRTLWFLTAITILQHVASSDEGACRGVPPKKRVECGWPRISKAECESRGCCFDSSIRRSLWCFRKHIITNEGSMREAEQRTAVIRSCSVSPRDRVDCGWPRIKEEVCENRGCCYSEEYKESSWCFYPKTIFTPPSLEKIMKCVSKCAGVSWAQTLLISAACQTNVNCWKLRESPTGETCMSLCKTSTSETEFIGNLSSCLRLTPESQSQTRRLCKLNLKCWMKRYGDRSENCSEEYVRLLEGRVRPTASSTLDQIGQIAKHPDPEIEMPPYLPNIPQEPNLEESDRLPELDNNTSRTDLNVERSVIRSPEDLTEDEEPNPWWEQGQVRA